MIIKRKIYLAIGSPRKLITLYRELFWKKKDWKYFRLKIRDFETCYQERFEKLALRYKIAL
jgi:hypothetical protein